MNYRNVWATLAQRAVAQSAIDAETFLARAQEAGMSAEQVTERLLEDLDSDGPIFGKFMRSLAGSASSSVLAAERQGVIAGHIQADEELSRLLELSDTEDAIASADPDALEDIADRAGTDQQEYTWAATLKNTCHRCLPLHGKTLTMAEWKSNGWLPEIMHEGWASDCQCHLIPERVASSFREELMSPLVRNKIPGSKKTTSGVSQVDVERARSSVSKAMESDAGRRIIEQLGRVLNDA